MNVLNDKDHPVVFLRRFGISDTRFVVVLAAVLFTSCFLLLAETTALVRLSAMYDGLSFNWWLRYFIPLGTVFALGSGILLYRRNRNLKREALLEVSLENSRHAAFRNAVEEMIASAGLTKQVRIFFLPWRQDANAYVTKESGHFKLVVTRGMIALHSAAPEQAAAILRHELSHMEADDVRFSNNVRDTVTGSLLLIAMAGIALLLVYGIRKLQYFDYGNDLPVTGALVISFVVPLAAFFYYREYLIGREYLHDLRAAQASPSAAPLIEYLESLRAAQIEESVGARIRLFFRHFRAFHPTPGSRIANLNSLDLFRNWNLASPFFAGAFLALVPIELALALAAFQLSDWQRVAEWIALISASLLLLQNDIARFAIYAIFRKRAAARIVLFFLSVLIGSQLAILPFLVLSALIKHHSLIQNLLYSFKNIRWTALAYCGTAVFVSYVWAIRFVSSYGPINSWIVRFLSQAVFLITVVFFAIVNLSGGSFSPPLTILWFIAYSVCLFWIFVSGRCAGCSKHSWRRLFLQSRCSFCGHEPLLKIPGQVRDRVKNPV